MYVMPSMLKFNPAREDVTDMVPVETVHVGCTTEIVGADGVDGWTFTVATVILDSHPDKFLAVILYEPLAIPLKIPVALE